MWSFSENFVKTCKKYNANKILKEATVLTSEDVAIIRASTAHALVSSHTKYNKGLSVQSRDSHATPISVGILPYKFKWVKVQLGFTV